jgi:Fic family protein
LYLSVFFKKHRQTYYERLQQVRLTGDWESWLLFFVDAITATATQAVATAQQLNQLLAADKGKLAQIGRLAGSANQILEALFNQPIVSINLLVEKTGLTPATIGKALDAMQNTLGLVRELTGQKRNRVYAYSAYIDILNQD